MMNALTQSGKTMHDINVETLIGENHGISSNSEQDYYREEVLQ